MDFNTNLTNSNHDDFLKFDLASQVIEERDKENTFDKLENTQQICAIILAILHRKIDEFQDDINLMATVYIADNVIQNLRNLRTLFRTLQDEDRSQNLDFALQLSKAWHGVLSYHQLASAKEMRQLAYEKMTKLINLFNRYPTADEHSLGHYLANFAGENWLPFPFMGILNDLYEENLDSGEKSNLAKLIHLITNIIESFNLPH